MTNVSPNSQRPSGSARQDLEALRYEVLNAKVDRLQSKVDHILEQNGQILQHLRDISNATSSHSNSNNLFANFAQRDKQASGSSLFDDTNNNVTASGLLDSQSSGSGVFDSIPSSRTRSSLFDTDGRERAKRGLFGDSSFSKGGLSGDSSAQPGHQPFNFGNTEDTIQYGLQDHSGCTSVQGFCTRGCPNIKLAIFADKGSRDQPASTANDRGAVKSSIPAVGCAQPQGPNTPANPLFQSARTSRPVNHNTPPISGAENTSKIDTQTTQRPTLTTPNPRTTYNQPGPRGYMFGRSRMSDPDPDGTLLREKSATPPATQTPAAKKRQTSRYQPTVEDVAEDGKGIM